MESLALSLAMLWGLHLPRGSQVHLLPDGDSSVRAALGLTGRVRTRLASLRPLVDPCFCSQKPEATAGMCSMLRGTLSTQPTSLSMPSRAQCARTISAIGSRSTLQSAACAKRLIGSGYGCCPTAAGTRPFLPFGRFAVVWPRHRFLGTFLSLFLSSSHVAGNRLRLRLPVDTRSASQPHLSMRRP